MLHKSEVGKKLPTMVSDLAMTKERKRMVSCDVCERRAPIAEAQHWMLSWIIEPETGVVKWTGIACNGRGHTCCGTEYAREIGGVLMDGHLLWFFGSGAWKHLRRIHRAYSWPPDMFDALAENLEWLSRIVRNRESGSK